MDKILILVSGIPGAGKTYLAKLLMEAFPQLTLVSQDEVEERRFDKRGFDHAEEKRQLIEQCRKEYYEEIRQAMEKGVPLISDYPFSYKQEPYFKEYCAKYGYRVLTIRLIGDTDVLYQRRIRRDLDPSRHPGHLFSHYHKGEEPGDRTKADQLISYDDFVKKIDSSGYRQWSMGELIEVDVTDLKTVDYLGLINKVKEWMRE